MSNALYRSNTRYTNWFLCTRSNQFLNGEVSPSPRALARVQANPAAGSPARECGLAVCVLRVCATEAASALLRPSSSVVFARRGGKTRPANTVPSMSDVKMAVR